MKKSVNTIVLILLAQLIRAQNSTDNILMSVAKNNKTLLSYFYTAYDNYLKAENEYNQAIAMLYKYQL